MYGGVEIFFAPRPAVMVSGFPSDVVLHIFLFLSPMPSPAVRGRMWSGTDRPCRDTGWLTYKDDLAVGKGWRAAESRSRPVHAAGRKRIGGRVADEGARKCGDPDTFLRAVGLAAERGRGRLG